MGISDVLPVPVEVDKELEKWTIWGRPLTDVWFTTTEKIHQIIDMGPIKNVMNWGRKNSLWFLMQPRVAAGWRCSSLARRLTTATGLEHFLGQLPDRLM